MPCSEWTLTLLPLSCKRTKKKNPLFLDENVDSSLLFGWSRGLKTGTRWLLNMCMPLHECVHVNMSMWVCLYKWMLVVYIIVQYVCKIRQIPAKNGKCCFKVARILSCISIMLGYVTYIVSQSVRGVILSHLPQIYFCYQLWIKYQDPLSLFLSLAQSCLSWPPGVTPSPWSNSGVCLREVKKMRDRAIWSSSQSHGCHVIRMFSIIPCLFGTLWHTET